MRVVLAIVFLLHGCGTTGYVFGGVGYAAEIGYTTFDESGAVATIGGGLKFNDHLSCEFRHRSMVNKQPEVITNDTICKVTVHLWSPK